MSFENGAACLSLTRCSPGNAGRYTCIAENPAGKQSSTALLHVTGNIKSSKATNAAQQHRNDLFTVSLIHSVNNETATKEIPGTINRVLRSEVTFKAVSHENAELFPVSAGARQSREERDNGRLNDDHLFNFLKIFLMLHTH